MKKILTKALAFLMFACSSAHSVSSSVASNSSGRAIAIFNSKGDSDQGSFDMTTTILEGGKVTFDDPEMNFTLVPGLVSGLVNASKSLNGNLRHKTTVTQARGALSRGIYSWKARNQAGNLVTFSTQEWVLTGEDNTITTSKDVDSSGGTASADAVLDIMQKVEKAHTTWGDIEGRPDAERRCREACEINVDQAGCLQRLHCGLN